MIAVVIKVMILKEQRESTDNIEHLDIPEERFLVRRNCLLF
jgi:hypothetical protein